MNWDAIGSIGEVLGSLGVIVTLVYFAMQLRGSQVATRILAESVTQESRITINNHRFENMALIDKVNRGDKLTEVEQSQLRLIVQNENIAMSMSFRRFRALGEEGYDQARFFAIFLCNNPGLEAYWVDDVESRTVDFGSERAIFTEWNDSVRQHVLDVKRNRGEAA